MTKILDQAVSKDDDDTWTFRCPGVAGSVCGGADGPFSSTGWPTKQTALARGRQHFDEHKGGPAMQTLEEFRAEQGLTVDADGGVKVEDL